MQVGTGLLVKKPKPNRNPKKTSAIPPNFRISLLLVELEFTAPVSFFFPERLLSLEKHTIFYHQYVHLGSHKAAVSVLRCAYNRFTPYIETRVHDHRAPR